MKDFIDSLRDIDYAEANSKIYQISGIVDFFDSNVDKETFLSSGDYCSNIVCDEQSSYGDWQTPVTLAREICKNHLHRFGQPDIIIEPTCGLGTFVLAAIDAFPKVKSIFAIEINREYVTQLKTRLLSDAIVSKNTERPDIHIYNADFFNFDFSHIAKLCTSNQFNIGIIGNPPWVTNSHQGKKESLNLPKKTNEHHLRGIDALTGKSNFDISEYITTSLLKALNGCKGGISFLLKNSVIRNIISKQVLNCLPLSDIKQEKINAAKEFDVSVEASCLSAVLGHIPSNRCDVFDFYTRTYISTFGWLGTHFTSDFLTYEKYSQFDSKSTYIWRSGIKHDCAAILELTYENGAYINGLGVEVDVEDEYVYPLLKSSDIQKDFTEYRKFVIIPQRKIGQDTSYLEKCAPKLYTYLLTNIDFFLKRKSSIYKNKDRFSVFGIGDYSFKPYKIVISSLYKTIKFKLLKEYRGKPVLVDDTCYQLDFDTLEEANVILEALQSVEIQSLLNSLVFKDAKRIVTKSLLMRLNLAEYCKQKGLLTDSTNHLQRMCQQLSLFD